MSFGPNSYYKEYPVCCQTCGELIAAYAPMYEALIVEMSIKEALDSMGIMAYCSRSAMQNPTTVFYNLEIRKLIEGCADINSIDESDLVDQDILGGSISFNCAAIADPEALSLGSFQPAAPQNIVALPMYTPPRIGQPVSLYVQPVARPQIQISIDFFQVSTNQIQRTAFVPQYPGQQYPGGYYPIQDGPQRQTNLDFLADYARESAVPFREREEALAKYGIQEQVAETPAFKYPTYVGIPEINDAEAPYTSTKVGGDMQVQILGGRTYIAK